MRYTFGTGDTAANRLEEIAKFFNPLSIQFIGRYVREPIGSVIDLGCGPGFTTSMLSQAMNCPNVYGLDSAPHFLKMAKDRFKHFTFIEHDVVKTPFPVQGDVMYSRFLLSHLKDVVNLVNRWTGELLDEGILIIEELEGIDTEIAVFQKYLRMNTGLIESQGAELYVGKILVDGVYHADVFPTSTWWYQLRTARRQGGFIRIR